RFRVPPRPPAPALALAPWAEPPPGRLIARPEFFFRSSPVCDATHVLCGNRSRLAAPVYRVKHQMIHASPARLCVAMALCLCGVSPATARGDALEQATQARARGEWLAALAIYERLQADSPEDAELYRLRTLTLADVGSA